MGQLFESFIRDYTTDGVFCFCITFFVVFTLIGAIAETVEVIRYYKN